MTSAVPHAPAFPSLDYFRRPPRWVRDMTGLMTALLLLAGLAGAAAHLGDTAPGKFTKVSSSLGDTPGTPPAKFASADGVFRAGFPVTPRHNTQSIDEQGISLRIEMYTALKDGVGYVVGTFPHAPGLGFDFDAAAHGAAQAERAKLDSVTPTTFGGFPAALVQMTKEGSHLRQLIVRSSTHVVQLVVAGGTQADYETFRDSLEIL